MVLMWAGMALAVMLAQSPAPDPIAAAEAKAASGDLAGALEDYRALVAGAGASRGLVLYRLANLERRLGNDDAAVAHALEAAAAFRQGGEGGRASEALNLAAMTEFNRASYPAAADHLHAAIRLSGEAADWERQAEQIGNLGSVFYVVGRYDDAARVNRQALAVIARHDDAPWASRRGMVVVANQAALSFRLGRYAEALALYRTLHRSGEPLPPSEHAQVLVNEGALFRRLGDPYKALLAYDEAAAAFGEANDARGRVSVLTNRGIALALDLGRADDAVTTFSEAGRLASTAGNRREELLARLYRGETRLRSGRGDLARLDFNAALAVATALDTREEQWKAWYGLGRVELAAGRDGAARDALDRAIAIVDALREQLAIPSTRAEFFQDKREVYDARIALGLEVDSPAAVFALIERSRARAWRDRMKLDEVTLASAQQRLAPGTVLLAYWWSARQAAVVRITADSASLRRLSVPPDLVAAMASAMRQPTDVGWTATGEALGQALVPRGLVAGAARIVVVPDGPLGSVPFEALIVNGAPLATRAALSYLPTAALLQRAEARAATWRPPWARQLAAFGDPRPGDDPWGSPTRTPRLAASAAEVRDISEVLGGRHELFLGANDRKSALVDVLARPPAVLHVATHGVVDLVSGEQSRLLFSPEVDGGTSESLFLREVYDLPLGAVDLAVLSACDTERGPDVRGEGVQGFSRGLLAAGARRAVTTLWRVPDGATAAFMHAFYTRVQRGEPLDHALAHAKRAFLANPRFAHPHYWAAFVLTGSTEPLARALRWRDVAGVALVGLGSAAGLAALLGRRRSPTTAG